MKNILTNEDLEFLKELANELKTQDNLATRKPLIFKIAVPGINWLAAADYSEDIAFHIDTEVYTDVEAIEYLNNTYELNLSNDLDHEKIKELLDENGETFEELYGINNITYKGEFLTRKSAAEHLKSNLHHYTKDSYIYIDHGYRNPILEKLLNIVEKF